MAFSYILHFEAVMLGWKDIGQEAPLKFWAIPWMLSNLIQKLSCVAGFLRTVGPNNSRRPCFIDLEF